jgi:hypothetical protein
MSITNASTDTRTINDLVKATGLPGNTDISLLPGLTVRAHNCMKRDGIYTLDDLAERDDGSLRDIRNFGVISLDHVRTVLSQLAERYAHIMQTAPPWLKEIIDLAGALSNGYDEVLNNDVLARLSEVAPGYLVCVWTLHDASGYGGDSEIYLDADAGGGLCEVGGDLWSWLCEHPLAPGTPFSPGDPATWKGNRVGFDLDDLPVDDTRHNYARHDG